MFTEWIRRIFRNKDGERISSSPDIRYADPSHDPNHQAAMRARQCKDLSSQKSIPAQSHGNASKIKAASLLFRDMSKLKNLTLTYLQQHSRQGCDRAQINNYIVSTLAGNDLAPALLEQKYVRGQLAKARQALKAEKLIGYSYQKDNWYNNSVVPGNLSEKEQNFLAMRGLGEGWTNIANLDDAIQWLYQNFTSDQFENFCAAIMTSHCQMPVKITQKRPISGADGGFDAIGQFEINGKLETFAVQAKRYALNRQVGQNECRDFLAALQDNGWRYGFMVTTGTFSDRSKQTIANFERMGVTVEMIDQKRLANIMLQKTTLLHGFGLYRTEIGRIFINEKILKRAGEQGFSE